MRHGGAPIRLLAHGSCCASHLPVRGRIITLVRTYSERHQPGVAPPNNPTPPDGKGEPEVRTDRTKAVLQHAGEMGRQWVQKSTQVASVMASYWMERYEEFVGLNEVRVAQTNVTEAETAFMVARGMVHEAQASLEALQVRLKEVRDRLDRVSREETHYLELVTLEHKLLQDERRFRTAYEKAESSEREKFALFSAAVRASHEKERTRAERTKNWSIVGSVIGALIGVVGSTYINRVRLQELKSLLLEAQKGPETLQEAVRVQAVNHRSQQEEIQMLIGSLKVALQDSHTEKRGVLEDDRGRSPKSAVVLHSALKDLCLSSRKTETLLESLPPQLGQLEKGIRRVEGQLSVVRELVDAKPQVEQQAVQPQLTTPERPEGRTQPEPGAMVQHLEEHRRTLAQQIRSSALYNAAFTYSASAIVISAVYLLLRGGG
ncbi:mitochondrial potassium channel [Brachionichthys hirsutus]|uniref:mitochondrial potassium channel n=1 Tax=Brachionichthys hirsutus TaxID=412623 RepID=UPI003604CAC0